MTMLAPTPCRDCGRLVRYARRGDGEERCWQPEQGGPWTPAGSYMARVGAGRGSFALHKCRPRRVIEQLTLEVDP